MRSIQKIASGSVVQQLCSTAIFLILTHALGATGYGVFATATALATSCFSFGSFWASPYIVRSGVNQIAANGRLGDTFVKGGAISVGGTIVATIIAVGLTRFKMVDVPVGSALILLLALSTVSMALLRTGLQTVQNFPQYARYLWLDRGLLLVLLLLLLAFSALTSRNTLVASGLASLVVGVGGLGFFLSRYVDVNAHSFSLSDFTHSSAPVFLATTILYFSSASFIVFAASSLYGLRAAAWTSVAFVAAGQLTQPITWLTPTLLPRFTRSFETGATSDFRVYLDTVVLPLVTVYALGTTVAVLLLPLVPLVLGADFRGAGPIVGLILGAFVAEVVNLLVVQLLYARNQQKTLLLISAIKGAGLVFIFTTRSVSTLREFAMIVVFSYWLSIAVELWPLRDLLSPRFVRYLLGILVLSVLPSIAAAFLPEQLAAIVGAFATIGLGWLTWSQRFVIARRLNQASGGRFVWAKSTVPN
jgi:O-antigen/teichoic acid export membrane protein